MAAAKVLGGLAVFGIGIAGAQAISDPLRKRRPTETDRKHTFDAIGPCYDAEIHTCEQAQGYDQLRRRLLAQASGATLEVAAGTGRNIAFYPAAVTSLLVTDFSQGQLQTTACRLRN